MPFVQLLFALDGLLRRSILFHVNEPSDAVLLDEFGALARAVQLHPCAKLVGDADVERPMLPACKDVDEVGGGGVHLVAQSA